MKAIEKAWEENLKHNINDQWSDKEDIIKNCCPFDNDLGVEMNDPQYCKGDYDGEYCTKCWNREILTKEYTFKQLECSSISNITLDDTNENELINSLKNNEEILHLSNCLKYNEIPVLIKWLLNVYDYCIQLKKKNECVDWQTARSHMELGNNAKFGDVEYFIKDGELYWEFKSNPTTTSLTLPMIDSNQWILL